MGNYTNKPVIVRPDNHLELDTPSHDVQYAVMAINIFVSATGTVGNLVTFISICLCKKLWTIPNVYIGHLALVDLFVCCLVVPIGLHSNITGEIPTGCAFWAVANIGAMIASLVTLWMISINRYILIIRGQTTYVNVYTKRNVIISVGLIWLYVLLCLVPIMSGAGTLGYSVKYKQCFFISYDFDTYVYVAVCCCGLAFVPPSTFTTYAYIRIIYHFKKSRNAIKDHSKKQAALRAEQDSETGDTEETVVNSEAQSKPKTKAEKDKGKNVGGEKVDKKGIKAVMSMIAVFIVFVTFWTPVVVTYYIDYFGNYPAAMHMFAVSLAWLNSGVNIFLYVFMNKTHREAYKLMVLCKCKELKAMR